MGFLGKVGKFVAKNAVPGAGVAMGLLSGLFGAKGEKKKQEADNAALLAQANLKQKMGEDQRRGALDAGSSMLQRVAGSNPAAFNGKIDLSGFAIDPAVLERLKQERAYDFAPTVPKAGAGMGSALLSGLFGDIRDTLGHVKPSVGMPEGGPVVPDLGTMYDPTMDPFSPKYRG
jgi:hypothetical protein